MRLLVPRARGSAGEPGMAKTPRFCSIVEHAVIIKPDLGAASITTIPLNIPDMMRLRRGKCRASKRIPTSISETMTPRSKTLYINTCFVVGK